MTMFEIMQYLGVSETQVSMAIYSGRIPRPDEDGNWDVKKIEIYLDRWKRLLDNKRNKEAKTINYERGKLEIPRHTR
jgi:hypothetical protein